MSSFVFGAVLHLCIIPYNKSNPCSRLLWIKYAERHGEEITCLICSARWRSRNQWHALLDGSTLTNEFGELLSCIMQVSCKSCSKNFCFRHRHEDDHKCEGAATAVAMTRTTVAQRQTAGAAAGGSISNPFRRAAAAASSTPAAGNAGANGRGCGTEAKAAADRRAAAAEGRRRSAGRGAGITSH